MKKFEKFKSANVKVDLRNLTGGNTHSSISKDDPGLVTDTHDLTWEANSTKTGLDADTTPDGDFFSHC